MVLNDRWTKHHLIADIQNGRVNDWGGLAKTQTAWAEDNNPPKAVVAQL
jgi:hypothetical protein